MEITHPCTQMRNIRRLSAGALAISKCSSAGGKGMKALCYLDVASHRQTPPSFIDVPPWRRCMLRWYLCGLPVAPYLFILCCRSHRNRAVDTQG
jgi:hypothetical protein